MPTVPTDRKLTVFLLLYSTLLLLSFWQLNLMESTEARYAEIAREMLASGNFLEPRFNGIYHFHKPPLPYWAMAAGMALFGVNDFGVRFFGAGAAILALIFFYRTALLYYEDLEQAYSAVLVLASSLLFIAVSRVVSTDIYLTCCVLGAHYFLFSQMYGQRSRANAAGYGLMLGLGFMVKGPIVFLFTLLPQLTAKFFDQRHRRLFGVGDILTGLGCFLVIALPWYIAVISKHPDLFAYFTKTQTVDRLATEHFKRNKPFWYFPLLFTGTFFPFTIPLLRGAFFFREWSPRFKPLVIYILVPLAIFCVSKSKLPPYILPFYGVASLLALYVYRQFKSLWDDRAAFLLLIILAAGTGGAALLVAQLRPVSIHLGAIGVVTVAAVLYSKHLIGTDRMLPATAAIMLVIATAAFLLVPQQLNTLKYYKKIVLEMNRLDPAQQVPVVLYREFLPSVSFYRQKLAIMANGRDREVGFEEDAAYRQWYIEKDEEIQPALAGMDRLFLITGQDNLAGFQEMTSLECRELQAQNKKVSYDCRRNSSLKPPKALQ